MIGVREPLPGVIYPPAERLHRYVEGGELPQTTLVESLIASFAKHADRVALYTPEGQVTYAELDDITSRFAAAMRGLGLEPLDRIMFQSTNSKELIFAIVGCFKAGLIPICALAAHREREIGYLGRHADVCAHIVQGDDPKFDLQAFALKMQAHIPTMRHVISLRSEPRAGVERFEDLIANVAPAYASVSKETRRDPFQVAIFQLSGGTTGVPKIIPRMQNDYLLNAQRTAEWLGYTSTDVMFMPMPIIHNACMICFWVPTLLSGAAYAIAADMTPESWGKVFRASCPTWVGLIRALVPRLEAMIEGGLGSLDSVRAFWCPDAARLLREKFNRPTFAMFGMSEGLNMYTGRHDSVEVRDWTVGRPLCKFDEVRLVSPGTEQEVALGEIGELVCRGPYTLAGYYNAPERNQQTFTSEGFYKSGDLMVCTEIAGERIYAFAGRTNDVVARGQEKINCEEVEHAVSSHEAVSGCAVVGMPDEVLGERICAYVVLRNGFEAPSVAVLGQHMQNIGLAKFKWPERVEVIDALPLSRVGKLDKAPLRVDIGRKLAPEAPAVSR